MHAFRSLCPFGSELRDEVANIDNGNTRTTILVGHISDDSCISISFNFLTQHTIQKRLW